MLKASEEVRLVMSQRPARLARFGVFELDTQANELRRRGLRVHLPDQAARVLRLLVLRQGSIVTTEELRRELWQDSLYVDFGHAIHNAMNRVRRALQDSAEHPRYVETVPRRGYRFLAPVEWFSIGEPPGTGPAREQTTAQPGPIPTAVRGVHQTALRPRVLLTGAGILLLLAASLVGAWRTLGPASTSHCTHPNGLRDNRVTMVRAFRGQVLSVCQRGADGGDWVVYRSGGDGRHAMDSGAEDQVVAYAGGDHVEHLEVLPGGVVTVLFHSGWKAFWEIWLSPDGEELKGGGKAQLVYRGTSPVERVAPYGDGMLTVFRGSAVDAADRVYFSPDGRDPGGGGRTRKVYDGPARVDAIQPFRGGVLTALSDPTTGEPRGVFLSPDGEHLGGGGETAAVYLGQARVHSIAVTQCGVLTAFRGRAGRMSRVFLSPDGRRLGGGGGTRLVYGGWGEVEMMVPYRQGVITAFRAPSTGESLGIYFSPDCDHLAGGESTVSLNGGADQVSALAVVDDRILAAFVERSERLKAGRLLELSIGGPPGMEESAGSWR
jgi:DNA-binding winged helix-turn-helix (wHTH) protein